MADQRPRSGGTPEIFGDISAIERRSRREQVSEELALSEATWHAAFESAPVAIAEVDLEGTIIPVSYTHLRAHGPSCAALTLCVMVAAQGTEPSF